MYPNYIKAKVKKYKANIGISFDGDADRIIIVMKKVKLSMETKLLQ